MQLDPERYLERERTRLLSELMEFLRIPSCSGPSVHRGDVARAAEWLAGRARAAGFQRVEVEPTGGHPIVRADWTGAPGAPTALVYGHYDVQPPDPVEAWTTPPFEPTVRDGALYARGASDDKGPVFVHLAAAEALLRTTGRLPVNLRLVIEGEEEVSSPNLLPYLEAHREELRADVAVISDTPLLGLDMPTICTSLRGLCDCEIGVRTAAIDLHSGQFGGGVPNALHVLAELLAGLHDGYGRVAVAGFYDRVRPQRSEVRLDEEALRRQVGAPLLWGEAGWTAAERLWYRPTLEVNGAWGGFTGEGPKTVIPCEAHAKLTARLVPDQDPEEVLRLIERHLRQHCPPTAELSFVARGRGRPAAVDRSHPAVQAAARALRSVFGQDVAFVGEGGSIPVVQALADTLGLTAVLLGFTLPDDGLHAPNEHFRLECFDLGLRTLCAFWPELAAALGPAA
jgi:acetylornithine deacetylase/succinyl-diaminopimelate desuccinylase-like protein